MSDEKTAGGDIAPASHKEDLARFNEMKAGMGWTWEDVERITGRKYPRTNFSKKVPSWVMLAIEVYEKLKAK